MLSDEEKAKVRAHLGYISATSFTGLALGVPVPLQTLYVLENTLDRIMPESEARVRRMIAELDCIEDQLSKVRSNVDVRGIAGGPTFRGPEALDQLRMEYGHWARKLADACGSVVNPYSQAHLECSNDCVVINPC